MENENGNILEKIKKLLRLGTSDNINESAAAIAAAQRLMEKHSINQAMLEDANESDPTDKEEVRNWEQPLDDSGRLSSWKSRLGLILAKANGCMVFTSRRYKEKTNFRIIGKASNVSKVRYLYSFCINEIERITKAEAYGNGKVWCNNFRLGCVEAIQEAIQKEREALREEFRKATAGNSQALVKVNRAIAKVDKELDLTNNWARRNLRLRNASGSSYRSDHGAREAGRKAGASIYPSGKHRGIGAGRKQIN